MRHDCEFYHNPESGKCDCCEDIGGAVGEALLEKQKVVDELREELERLHRWADDIKIGERINYRKRYEEILEGNDIDVSENRKLLEENSELKEQLAKEISDPEHTHSELEDLHSKSEELVKAAEDMVVKFTFPYEYKSQGELPQQIACQKLANALAKFRGGV